MSTTVHAVCSNRIRPSVQRGAKGSQWWARDVYHVLGAEKRTLCGLDASDWLDCGEVELNGDCCSRCSARAASPSPASPADEVAGLIADAKLLRDAVHEYNRGAHGLDTHESELWAIAGRIENAAAALSRLQARLAEVTAERDFERGERRRVSDLCDETEHERAVAAASAATMLEALTAARPYIENLIRFSTGHVPAALLKAKAKIDAALGGQHG